MIKKVCSLILAFCVICGSFTAWAFEDTDTEKEDIAAELISGFGIMNAESKTEFGADKLVKRGEFALYAARLFGNDIKAGSSGATGYFEDVDLSTPEGAAVNFLAANGIIPKSGREYNPNDEVTYAEAVRILLNGLGYADTAASSGGFPGGYIKAATDCDLNKGVSMLTNSVLTKADTAVLLYNALFVKPIIHTGYQSVEISDKTLMEKSWDVYSVKGIVTGFEGTVLGSTKKLPDNMVEIDGVVYNAGTTSIGDYVGYSIKAYYRDVDDIRTIVAFTQKQGENNVKTIDADDLEINGNKVSYYDNDSRKSVKVANSVSVIYNGRHFSGYSNLEELLDIDEGEVIFIANDSSNTANIIIVRECQHLLVERVDKKNRRLYLKNGSSSTDAKPYLSDVITLSEDDTDVYVYLDGKEIEFSDIQSDDAITMERTYDGTEAYLYVSREAVSGKITSVSDEYISINDADYKISKYSTNAYTSGNSGTYAITTDGKLLGLVSAAKAQDVNYAYVLDVYTDAGPDEAYVKLYTAGGEIKNYKCANNFMVNGQKKKFDQVQQAVLKSEIVTYRTDSEDNLIRINRPYDVSSKVTYVNETQFIKNWNKSSVRYINGIMGMSCITDNTVIFSMPRFDRDKESDYRILTLDDMENRVYADVTCYDVDRQGRAGAVLIVEDYSDSVSMSNNLFFVKKKLMGVQDDEEVCIIEGYEAGEEKTLTFTKDTDSVTYEDGWMNYVGNEDFDTGYNDLHEGDAIQYNLDNEGNVGAYRLVYNNFKTLYDPDGTRKDETELPESYYEDWSGTGSVTKQDFRDNLYIAFGDVQYRYMDYVLVLGLNKKDRLTYESGSNKIQIIDYYRPINLLNASVYKYNMNTCKLEIGDMEDVSKEDMVFVRSKNMGEINEIMVYVED